MEYKLFDEYITLQALLKELSIIPFYSTVRMKNVVEKNFVMEMLLPFRLRNLK